MVKAVLKLKAKPLNKINSRKDSAKVEVVNLGIELMTFPGHITKEGRIGSMKEKSRNRKVQRFQCPPSRNTKEEKLRQS